MTLRATDAGRPGRSLCGALAGALLALLLTTPLSGCWLLNTQRWPKPARPTADPLPPGHEGLLRRGPEEVLIVRHADPVQVKPPESISGFPLPFHSKRVRVNAGTAVLVSAGGRAEILWPLGSSIIMFGEGVGLVGSPSRGEATFVFADVDRATLNLAAGDEVRLLGGSILTGDAGPYLLERVRTNVLRVRNQSKGPLSVAFREELFDLSPGHVVDLPLLEAGGEPRPGEYGLRQLVGAGFSVGVRGEVVPLEDPEGIRLKASGEHQITGLGVRVHLAEGEEVLFTGLGDQPPEDLSEL